MASFKDRPVVKEDKTSRMTPAVSPGSTLKGLHFVFIGFIEPRNYIGEVLYFTAILCFYRTCNLPGRIAAASEIMYQAAKHNLFTKTTRLSLSQFYWGGGKKCEIWLNYSIPLAFDPPSFRNGQDV